LHSIDLQLYSIIIQLQFKNQINRINQEKNVKIFNV